jgi:Na+/H+-translocating membrane pyrophosphatase
MSGLPPEVREITDELDAVGNTTAAIGKGFAIGSATLTVVALFSAYSLEVNHALVAKGLPEMKLALDQPNILIGLLIGAVLPFIVSASTMLAVGKAAGAIVMEIKRQFDTIPGLREGKAEPQPKAIVDIATSAALSQMILPGMVAVLGPVVIGYALGPAALAGALGGALAARGARGSLGASAGGVVRRALGSALGSPPSTRGEMTTELLSRAPSSRPRSPRARAGSRDNWGAEALARRSPRRARGEGKIQVGGPNLLSGKQGRRT